ncbi:hypothetical protein L1987_15501 [Smallanthus sonchifolius]|uniref:Uncharacterized protein n=1 Tax=Smallanthus sonchifolius TaxID=185202 RepID=A0ACB9J696_9ASTR|nr:hypothetical protein L1987_15501 [Smallanthus sonchifolius]
MSWAVQKIHRNSTIELSPRDLEGVTAAASRHTPRRMYSRKESNLTESPHVDLGDEDSVEFVDEARHGDGDTPTKDIGVKGKRKNSSEVHPHFVEIDGLYRGKMV